MGVINTTPDSFSDGGHFIKPNSAVEHGVALANQGADILDIGGESTRPGAKKVSLQEELDRVIPVIERLIQEVDIPVSIDTYKKDVMIAAVNAGASMVNDVNALRSEGAVEALAGLSVPVCIMHMQGQPYDMQRNPSYSNVYQEVSQFFSERIEQCLKAGIKSNDIILDPGIGFGKSHQHNLVCLNKTDEFKREHNCELLIGVSRKSLIDKQLSRSVDQRLPASLGLAVQAVLNNAKIIRVHDVQASYDAIRMVEAVRFSEQ